ncbi:MAG: hypothetical protein AAGB05_16660, partial [Pseudomonadota bacterium]
MKLDIKLLIGASAIALLSLGGTASAQDCPRGDLDERFCDADGDLIADIPTLLIWALACAPIVPSNPTPSHYASNLGHFS